jgi:glycosyltransferase involved in cell wall biosynthesis
MRLSDTIGLSIIVPARNAASTLPHCLEAICAQIIGRDELIVVDDCSNDDTFEVAARFPVKVIRMVRHSGAAAARNRGASEASRPVLLFLDADVVLGPGGLSRAHSDMCDPGFQAVVGSYDDSPSDQSTVSMFKNLAHHFFHQQGAEYITSFWSGCGLLSRQTFWEAGGFDEKRLSIEDVEFGYRLSDLGIRIRIDRELRVTHLKRWTIRSLVVTDVARRAVPWTILSLERKHLPAELNFSKRQRAAALVALVLASCIPLIPLRPGLGGVLAVLVATAFWLNLPLYILFLKKGGGRLMLAGFFLQQFYYLYSLSGLAAGAALFSLRRGWLSLRHWFQA